jgi:hypothetical protein
MRVLNKTSLILGSTIGGDDTAVDAFNWSDIFNQASFASETPYVLFWHFEIFENIVHTSSVERFSENFDDKVVTYLIFFLRTH